MNPQLNYMLARQHIADLQRDADGVRLASEVDARRRGSPDSNPIARLNAHVARLIGRLALAGRRDANHTARTPLALDPVFDMSPLTEPACADVP